MIAEKLNTAGTVRESNEPKRAKLNIVFMAHPTFSNIASMVRFHSMLLEGMRNKGHNVQTFTPKSVFNSLPAPKGLKKYLGYIDQFVVFPRFVKKQLKSLPPDTLFVFTDNNLGPWVPLVAHMPHVIHCHDFMAQQASLGQIEEIKVGWSGRQYQNMILKGYGKGRNFISGSKKTIETLLELLPSPPKIVEYIINGLHSNFVAHKPQQARAEVSKQFGIDLKEGYILHVGGNQWYKNRIGVIEMYDAWRKITAKPLPLVMIGMAPSPDILETYNQSPYKSDIHFVTNAGDNALNLAYSGATVFLFPSKAEGFGWPIGEAMSAGCPVITTDEAPMTEVGGEAALFIPRRPNGDAREWAKGAGQVIESVTSLSTEQRAVLVAASIENAKRFDTDQANDRIEKVYYRIVEEHSKARGK